METERWGGRAGGGLRILKTNDLFQGGMCKEYTVLMWWGGNAVTSCSPRLTSSSVLAFINLFSLARLTQHLQLWAVCRTSLPLGHRRKCVKNCQLVVKNLIWVTVLFTLSDETVWVALIFDKQREFIQLLWERFLQQFWCFNAAISLTSVWAKKKKVGFCWKNVFKIIFNGRYCFTNSIVYCYFGLCITTFQAIPSLS